MRIIRPIKSNLPNKASSLEKTEEIQRSAKQITGSAPANTKRQQREVIEINPPSYRQVKVSTPATARHQQDGYIDINPPAPRQIDLTPQDDQGKFLTEVSTGIGEFLNTMTGISSEVPEFKVDLPDITPDPPPPVKLPELPDPKQLF